MGLNLRGGRRPYGLTAGGLDRESDVPSIFHRVAGAKGYAPRRVFSRHVGVVEWRVHVARGK